MATTTTNFGWDIPQSTDLVKDGATAIAALGQDIDTAFVDLKGGTTGQVLSKASGTDLDFTWSTAGGGSGLTLISRTTFSNTAAQIFDNVFTSSYYNYLVVIDEIYAATSGDDLQLQLRYAGPTTQAASYYGSSYSIPFSGSPTSTTSNNSSQMTISAITGSSGTFGSGHFFVNNVGNSSLIPSFRGHYVDSDANQMTFGGQINTARIYTGFLLKSSSSNITGAVSIYGLAKA